MKTSKLAAGGLGITLIAAMTLGGAATSASAADFYVTTLPAETPAGYPEGWFSGTATPQGTAAFTPDGLEVNGKFQLLNGTPATQSILDLADDVLAASENADWFFQIPIYGNPTNIDYEPNPNQCDGLQYTTLRPSVAGTTDPTIDWITSGRICNNGVQVYAPGAADSLTDLAAAISADGLHEILAYGFFWDTAVVDTFYWSDNGTDTSFFTPLLSTVITPNPVAISDYTAAGKGITISGTGFIPGSTVLYDVFPPGGAAISLPAQVADANGNVSFTYVGPAASVTGTYDLVTYYDEHAPDGADVEFFSNDFISTYVVALAATGAEFNPALFIGATSLLLAGAVLLIVRRRNATA